MATISAWSTAVLSKLKAFFKKIAPPWGGPGWNGPNYEVWVPNEPLPNPSGCCGVPDCKKCDTGYDADGSERVLTNEEIKEQDKEFYELTDPKGCHIEIFKDKKQEWRWRLLAKNNKIIACAGEGYKRRASMRKSLNIVREVIPFVPVKEE